MTKGIPIVAEHETWTSLDPVVGCPASCAYCFVQKFDLTSARPQVRASANEALEALKRHWAADFPAIGPRPQRFVALGNYTDMLMTSANRKFVLEYVQLHHDHFPEIPVVIPTKGSLTAHELADLDQIGQLVIVLVSQSFLQWFAKEPGQYERGVASPKKSCQFLSELASTRYLKPLHFWRPLCSINLPDERSARNQIRMIKKAGALASVAVGLKYGDFLQSEFSRAGHSFQTVFEARTPGGLAPAGEIFPDRLRQLALEAADEEAHPTYLNTSCALAFAKKIPEFLNTWRPPLRQSRCQPAICPEQQRTACFSQRWVSPTQRQVRALSGALGLPEDSSVWHSEEEMISVEAPISQDLANSILHTTGKRVHPLVLPLTREWSGAIAQASKTPLGSSFDYPQSGGLSPLVTRLRGITGMASPLTTETDPRPVVFSRYLHVRRVACVARALACRVQKTGERADLDRTLRLAWSHDLNRWPFAHNSESGVYRQSADMERFFSDNRIQLNPDDLRALALIVERRNDQVSGEALWVLLADQATGMVEDTLLAITALGIRPEFFPSQLATWTGLPLRERKFLRFSRAIRKQFLSHRLREYQEVIDRFIVGYATSFAAQGLMPSQRHRFTSRLRILKDEFLTKQLFPLVNDLISNSEFVRQHVVRPILRATGVDAVRLLTTLTESETIQLATTSGYISAVEANQCFANLDAVAQKRPDLVF